MSWEVYDRRGRLDLEVTSTAVGKLVMGYNLGSRGLTYRVLLRMIQIDV